MGKFGVKVCLTIGTYTVFGGFMGLCLDFSADKDRIALLLK